ncbi:MAG: uracil-DNA glycosylase [bacterium]
MDQGADLLENLKVEVKACRKCKLHATRTNAVFGEGSLDARVMFVGEAPGYHEDIQGKPFVGSAGQFLDQLLDEILGLKRDQVYIANILKCRPPENRDPASEEIEACKPYLLKQLEIISPDVICTLGNFATKTITGRAEGITKLRCKPIRFGKSFVFPMLHPAAALHRGDLYDEVRRDFENLKRFLDSPKPPEEPFQMELFG